MQEIYNRYFFYRKEEVQNAEPRSSPSLRFSPPRKTRNGSQVTGLARSLVNFEDLKSRDSLKKLSKESMVSSPLDRHQHSKMGIEEQGMSSIYSIRGRNDPHFNSFDAGTNLKSGLNSQSLLIDKTSVKEIMDSCTSQIGPAGYISLAKKELDRFNFEKTKNDDAMDRLMTLYVEYCDQL